MKLLVLVTARGGSKGFPGKNVQLLAGRPLVAWAMENARRLAGRTPGMRVFLSTDSQEIADAVEPSMRPHRLRPAHLAGDDSSSLDVVEHEVVMAAKEGHPPDAVLLYQPTSPLVDERDLDALVFALRSPGATSAALVTQVEHPVEWTFVLKNGVLQQRAGANEMPSRRQDCEPAWRLVGVFACVVDFFRRHKRFSVPGETRGVQVPAERAVDVDTPNDLAACASLLRSRPSPGLTIGTRKVGPQEPCFVIAEAGVNHNGSLERALELVRVAVAAKADAVKFQTFRAEQLVSARARKAKYQVVNTGSDDGQLSMLKQLELPDAAFAAIKAECDRLGIMFLSTPFDPDSAAMLARLGMSAFKVPSGELTNLPFLAELASYRLPLIISTGMGTLEEVEEAVATVRQAGAPGWCVLHCVSAYPAPASSINLRAMDSIHDALGCSVGYSDHTLGLDVCLAAVARGASVVEKHFTLSRELPGPDHQASLEPTELTELVASIRRVQAALGDGRKRPAGVEMDTRDVARRSLVASRALPAGTVLTARDLGVKRPASGVPPSAMGQVLGRTLLVAVQEDEPITWKHLGVAD